LRSQSPHPARLVRKIAGVALATRGVSTTPRIANSAPQASTSPTHLPHRPNLTKAACPKRTTYRSTLKPANNAFHAPCESCLQSIPCRPSFGMIWDDEADLTGAARIGWPTEKTLDLSFVPSLLSAEHQPRTNKEDQEDKVDQTEWLPHSWDPGAYPVE
jgi:hypothetical protein